MSPYASRAWMPRTRERPPRRAWRILLATEGRSSYLKTTSVCRGERRDKKEPHLQSLAEGVAKNGNGRNERVEAALEETSALAPSCPPLTPFLWGRGCCRCCW